MSKIKFIVKLPEFTKEYIYPKNEKTTVESLVSMAVQTIEGEHPGYCHPYEIFTEQNTWRVFGERVTAKDISEISGASYHVVRLWVQELKKAKNDNVDSREASVLFENFIDPVFQEQIKKGKKSYKKRKPALEGQEKLIRQYLVKDRLSVALAAKALGVATNTLRSYLVVKMPDVGIARRKK